MDAILSYFLEIKKKRAETDHFHVFLCVWEKERNRYNLFELLQMMMMIIIIMTTTTIWSQDKFFQWIIYKSNQIMSLCRLIRWKDMCIFFFVFTLVLLIFLVLTSIGLLLFFFPNHIWISDIYFISKAVIATHTHTTATT